MSCPAQPRRQAGHDDADREPAQELQADASIGSAALAMRMASVSGSAADPGAGCGGRGIRALSGWCAGNPVLTCPRALPWDRAVPQSMGKSVNYPPLFASNEGRVPFRPRPWAGPPQGR